MNILHLEDNRRDADLVSELLRTEWPDSVITLASTREEFITELTRTGHDVILSDFKLPGFSGREALALTLEKTPDVPFIFVSGTVGEETAVEIVREGAADYLLKDRLQRLPLAIQRALRDRDEHRRRREDAERIRDQAEYLNQARDAIIVTDLDNRIVYWNRGAERLLGWTAEEALGRRSHEHVASAVAAEIRTMHDAVEGASEWRGELKLCNKRGDPLIAEVRVTLIRDAAGRPKSRLKILTDITEKKTLEEQYLRAQRLECLGMLAAGIAHDLNNALAPILMAGQILRRRSPDPRDSNVLDILERSANRGAALVRQIVSFAGGASHEKVNVQVEHLLRDILDLAQETFPKSIQIESEVPKDLWLIHGNPTQIHQILLNLCINARDAMPVGGTLTVRAENRTLSDREAQAIPGATPGNFLLLEVADTGTGIPPEVLARIWDPFFTTKGAGKGTGLGLATVRGIATSHGGFLTVDSEVGRGSVFRAFLPAIVDRSAPLDTDAARAPTKLGRGELVLVVDDEASIREVVGAVLSQNGYRPITIAGGMEALPSYANRVADIRLVITDVEMPGLDGNALSQAILRLNPDVKIIWISGLAGGTETIENAARIGARLLGKPFTVEALLQSVHTLLGHSTAES